MAEKQESEIPEAQDLLMTLNLKDSVVTFYVMNTQKDTVAIITVRKGHYVGGLKGTAFLQGS